MNVFVTRQFRGGLPEISQSLSCGYHLRALLGCGCLSMSLDFASVLPSHGPSQSSQPLGPCILTRGAAEGEPFKYYILSMYLPSLLYRVKYESHKCIVPALPRLVILAGFRVLIPSVVEAVREKLLHTRTQLAEWQCMATARCNLPSPRHRLDTSQLVGNPLSYSFGS